MHDIPPFYFLRQGSYPGMEARLILQHALLRDISCKSVESAKLSEYALDLSMGACVPVGSVEFCREAFRLAGIDEPLNLTYPVSLQSHLHREVKQVPAGWVEGHWFIKSLTTKGFTGFVVDTLANPDHLSCYDRAQYNVFRSLPPTTLVWVSNPVQWRSEYRYYIVDGKILGYGRYDDGPDAAPCPAETVVTAMVEAYQASGSAPKAYSLDIGVLESGQTALVEVNDAWALGYYRGTLTAEGYAELLKARWFELLQASKN